jgi:MFS transporter, PHS family, inorganic phosphate transporter
MMAAVFSMQGLGQLCAGLIALITCAGFKESLITSKDAAHCTGVCGLAVDKMWRIIIGFGAVPGCIALYYRLTIPETPRYTFDVARDLVKGGSDAKAYLSGVAEGVPDEVERVKAVAADSANMEIPQASWSDFIQHYSKWKYGSVLLGTAGSWFLLDVAFYGLGLNNAVILQAIGFSGGRCAIILDSRSTLTGAAMCTTRSATRPSAT